MFTPHHRLHPAELPGLIAHDAEMVSAGVTTCFDALSIGDPYDDKVRPTSLCSRAYLNEACVWVISALGLGLELG